ncbi:MAG: hypothetical protein Tsb0014_30980 [Pleurocapsa sp.]
MIYKPSNFTFSEVLQKGLGRAFNYVNKNNKLEMREALLNACLHNLAYDPQCESSRAEWLFELICLTGDRDFYRENIFQALSTTKEFWDLQQLYDLVLIWAKEGNKEARELIYTTFKQQDFNESWLGGDQIIALDGIEGLLSVAEIVGQKILEDDELWEDDWLITQAGEQYEASKVWSILEKEALKNIKVKAYLDAVKSHTKDKTIAKDNRQKNRNQKISLARIFEIIEQKPNHFYLLSKFGRQATEDNIVQIFAKLLVETKEKQLVKYLYIFRDKALPRLDSRLFDLALSDNDRIQFAAITALANSKDDSLHNLAIELIEKRPKSINNRVLKLLINNYRTEDVKLIESILNKSQNIDTKHYIGMDLMEIIDTHKTSELISCCWWIYEQTPCAYCRQSILKILISLQQVPQAIIKECLQDCSADIRALANAY